MSTSDIVFMVIYCGLIYFMLGFATAYFYDWKVIEKSDNISRDAAYVIAVGITIIWPLFLLSLGCYYLAIVVAPSAPRLISHSVLTFGRGCRDLYRMARPVKANLPEAKVIKNKDAA